MAGPSSAKRSKASRFPAARIKKIMQMDEDVGKLASATPVMISKSLECFMQKILDEAAKEARSRGSKKLTAYHLKHTINNTPSFDFLLDIVSKIPDPVHTSTADSATLTPSASRRKPSSGGPSQPRQTSGSGAGRKRKAKEPISAPDPITETKGWGKREEEDDNYDEYEDDHDAGGADEDMEQRYRSGQPVRPGIGNLLNPTEQPKVEPVQEGDGGGGGGGGAARGMFDDYDDDDDY